MTEQVTEQVTPQGTPQVTPQVKELLFVISGEQFGDDLTRNLGIERIFEKYI